MSVTSIQLVGLFVVMMNSGAGLHILLPHFPDSPYADHVSVIQYSPDQVSSATWPNVAPCGPGNSLRCAPIALETIRFSGAIDPSPVDLLGNIPHLSCCCSSMTDILPKYKDPNATDKVAAHIFVDQGVAESLPDPSTRIDTWVTMHTTDPTGITVTGDTGTGTFNIVFKPGAQFQILNTMPVDPTGPSHFLAYYLMGVGSSNCTAIPSQGSPCIASAAGCLTASSTSKAVSRTATSKKRTKKKKTPKPPIPLATVAEIDIDCSNTHWP